MHFVSVITFKWSEIMGSYNTPDAAVRDRRQKLVMNKLLTSVLLTAAGVDQRNSTEISARRCSAASRVLRSRRCVTNARGRSGAGGSSTTPWLPTHQQTYSHSHTMYGGDSFLGVITHFIGNVFQQKKYAKQKHDLVYPKTFDALTIG